MMHDIPVNAETQINIFADDCCIWDSGLDIAGLNSNLQYSLESISNWCNKWGFRISPTKSAVVVFTRRRKIPPIELTVGGRSLPIKKEYKYLGVILDSKLTYRSHCTYVSEKCQKRMNLLRLLCGTTWGAAKSSLLTIYRTMIRPVIEYGFEAYLFSSKYVLETIQKLQNTA